jgi:NAD(P)H-dependent FMN reductase
MFKLSVIVTSTRPTRGGLSVAHWFMEQAKRFGKFDLQLLDLKEINLPLMDEPKHPRLQQYEHAHTKAWSEQIKGSDAFVVVLPEYNFSPPPALVNALDYLYVEWNYKAVGLVSYGGASGGLRSAQNVKLQLTTLKTVPLVESFGISFYEKLKDAQGQFHGTEDHEKAATTLLTELLRWTEALKTLRG